MSSIKAIDEVMNYYNVIQDVKLMITEQLLDVEKTFKKYIYSDDMYEDIFNNCVISFNDFILLIISCFNERYEDKVFLKDTDLYKAKLFNDELFDNSHNISFIIKHLLINDTEDGEVNCHLKEMYTEYINNSFEQEMFCNLKDEYYNRFEDYPEDEIVDYEEDDDGEMTDETFWNMTDALIEYEINDYNSYLIKNLFRIQLKIKN